MLKKIAVVIAIGAFLIFLFHPGRHARYYSYLEVKDMFENLLQSVNVHETDNYSFCNENFYQSLIIEKEELEVHYVLNNITLRKVLPGGEYVPLGCTSRFKSAIIVPYRDREEHLKVFLDYLHKFMQKQNIHYRIFVIEQADSYPFNRGKLLNVGAQEAFKANFTCFFLHDVDLLPLNSGHIYACSKIPRHLASGMDTLRYHLPYLSFTGGVFSITAEHFQKMNGMSNRFNGWGGEDDDFYNRLSDSNLIPCRFPPEYNKYKMLRHKKAKPSKSRWNELKVSLLKIKSDGLNSIPNNYHVVKTDLYTHVMV